MARELTVLTALALMLLPPLAAQSENPAAVRAIKTGKEHLRRNEFEMALKSLTTYAALEPEKSPLDDLLACTYLRFDSLDLASKNIAKSQQIDANEHTGFVANWLQGIVLLRQDNLAGADSSLSRAAQGSPSVAGRRIARARQYADSLFAGEDDTEQSSERYRLKLAVLLLDEYVDHQLLGEQ